MPYTAIQFYILPLSSNFKDHAMTTDVHQALRDDVRLLGGILGDTVRGQVGEDIYLKVEEIRTLAKAAYQSQDWQPLLEVMNSLEDSQLVPVARAFTQFLNYANIAEQHHRVRRRLSLIHI